MPDVVSTPCTGKSEGYTYVVRGVTYTCKKPKSSNTNAPQSDLTPVKKDDPREAAFKSWGGMWEYAFKGFDREYDYIQTSLANRLEECQGRYGIGSVKHKSCSEFARKDAQNAIEALNERESRARTLFSKESAALSESIPSTPIAPVPSLPSDAPDSMVNAYESWYMRWKSGLEGMIDSARYIQKSLANRLEECQGRYGVGSVRHKSCSESAIDSAKDSMNILRETLSRAKSIAAAEKSDLDKHFNVNVPSTEIEPSGGGTEENTGTNINSGNKSDDKDYTGDSSGIGGNTGNSNSNGAGTGNSNETGNGSGNNTGSSTDNGGNSGASSGNSTTVNNTTINNNGGAVSGKGESGNGKGEDGAGNGWEYTSEENVNSIGDSVDNLFGIIPKRDIAKDFQVKNWINGGNVTCPAPLVANTTFGELSLSFNWLCELLLKIRPIVLMVFSVSSLLLIVRGIRK